MRCVRARVVCFVCFISFIIKFFCTYTLCCCRCCYCCYCLCLCVRSVVSMCAQFLLLWCCCFCSLCARVCCLFFVSYCLVFDSFICFYFYSFFVNLYAVHCLFVFRAVTRFTFLLCSFVCLCCCGDSLPVLLLYMFFWGLFIHVLRFVCFTLSFNSFSGRNDVANVRYPPLFCYRFFVAFSVLCNYLWVLFSYLHL